MVVNAERFPPADFFANTLKTLYLSHEIINVKGGRRPAAEVSPQ